MLRRKQGYTLLELLVALLILSLLAAVTLPDIMGWLHQYRLQAAVVSITNHLRAARLLAVFTGLEHQVQIKPAGEGNYYQVVEDPDDTDTIVMSIGRIVLDKRFGEVQITRVTAGGRLTFYPKGTARNGSIYLENSVGTRVKVVVSTTGRIRTEYL
ncbi:prepilin-type N-terminal cleavage/methylation domain-containing protein [candidate division KSB3 bacterium]|nr:prepilin-type N-terminal cleavage/methylation domain-containing protein [candidate division KSB3 bacterium]